MDVAFPQNRRSFSTLQAGRAIAALLVVLFHCTVSISHPKYWGQPVFNNVFEFGSLGVEFFFVLSGFIILWAHRDDIGHPQALVRYAYRRMARVYPPYWIASIFVILAMTYIPQAASGGVPEIASLIESFALFGDPHSSILAVGWTLFHEMLFYACFGVTIVSKRWGVALLVAWALLIFVSPWEYYVFSPLNLLFMMGMAAAWTLDRRSVPWPISIFAAGLMVFGVSAAILPVGYLRSLICGAGAMLLILGAAELERSGRVSTPNWLKFLGDASYSIYLVHFVIISLVAKVTVGGLKELAFISMLTASVVGGVIFYVACERPTVRLVQRSSAARAAARRLRPRADPESV
ncbi:acyltransferase [Parafrankia sp. BMG5.11]|uniref:acyltransferase family protein n=1 Tax=Parafrankia sp. BMG5.11 TaxID=222540 RepID=UPI00103AE1EA|nr:acyltransferase [Parafrankia sp. BMG5.11]TCJ39575.1 acyltransferase [Parafrankia sp. BMG5.11]